MSYRIGVIADAAALVPLLSAKAAAAMFGLEGFTPGPDYRYAAGVGAALMAGWTVLLLWADRRPVERRGVLMLTVCPVLAGLIASGVQAVGSGFIDLPFLMPVFVFQFSVCALFTVAYLRATAYDRAMATAKAG